MTADQDCIEGTVIHLGSATLRGCTIHSRGTPDDPKVAHEAISRENIDVKLATSIIDLIPRLQIQSFMKTL